MLTPDEEAAVRSYTTSYYRRINSCLRGEDDCDDKIWSTVAALDQAVAKSTLSAETVVYRGVNGDYAAYLSSGSIMKGSIIDDVAYVSTSRESKQAALFAAIPPDGLMMRIVIPAGKKALDTAALSDFPHEEEILLPRDTRLRVLGYDVGNRTLEMEVI